jgi:hypothetical protein
MITTGTCNNCGRWVDALDRHRLCPPCHITRDDALENLREVAGMYCSGLPVEVAEALHAIPYIEKEHVHTEQP